MSRLLRRISCMWKWGKLKGRKMGSGNLIKQTFTEQSSYSAEKPDTVIKELLSGVC